MAGWENSDRRERLPADWPARRRKRLEIDGHRCTWRLPSGKRCPRKATDVDHRVEGSDDDRIEALQSLCADHHAKKTARAAARIKREKRQRRWRPQENHPGSF
jgi:hypothetical protein